MDSGEVRQFTVSAATVPTTPSVGMQCHGPQKVARLLRSLSKCSW